jgi:hypothetical protein
MLTPTLNWAEEVVVRQMAWAIVWLDAVQILMNVYQQQYEILQQRLINSPAAPTPSKRSAQGSATNV